MPHTRSTARLAAAAACLAGGVFATGLSAATDSAALPPDSAPDPAPGTRRGTAHGAAALPAHAGRGAYPVAPAGGDPARGRQVYGRYCTQCHGERGDGKGEAAPWTEPRPRDFRGGVFKFRSTAYGTLPTVADMDASIYNGLYGTLMPPFDALNVRARADVIAYLQTFSPRWAKEPPGAPVVAASEPAPTTASVARGHDLFAKNCTSCHGDGSGNGPAATGMTDTWGRPLAPADLTVGRVKSGATARDVYLRVAAGLNGTPMPGFAGTLSPAELWDVTHYVQALGPWRGSTRALREFAAQLPPLNPPATASSDSTAVPDSAATAPAPTDSPPTTPTPMTTVPASPPAVAAAPAARRPATDSAAHTKPAGGARPAAKRAPATIVVRMVGDASGYHFVPAAVTAHVGDVVRFVNVSGGPHNAAFWADSIPAGAAAQLQKNMGKTMGPLSGVLVSAPNAAYPVSLAGLPAGTYRYYCLPHLALKMVGRITVQP